MSKIGTVAIKGESGHKYEFAIYPIDSHFEEGHAGVYFVSARTVESGSHHSHHKVFIGETEDLSTAISGNEKKSVFDSEGANCISVHPTPDKVARGRILQDLLDRYETPGN